MGYNSRRLVIASILFNYVIGLLATVASDGGFTVELIRRDSHKSLFYNADQTSKEHLDAFRPRRMRKVLQNTLQSEVIAYQIGYINMLKLSIGTPPIDFYGVVDTGSDFIWTQCVPCHGCYKQIYPLFDPSKSSTYSDIPCLSEQCRLLEIPTCSPENLCKYAYDYEDKSISQGVLAKETVTMTSTSGGKVSIDIVFGCGHNNSGTFSDHDMGIIGLGGEGALSFVSQIASTFGRKSFSHCFAPYGTDPSISAGKMSFGNGSEVLGDGVVSTPLIFRHLFTAFFVTLNGISVGDKYLPYDSSATVSKGNVLLDSGSPDMLMPRDFYDRFVAEVKHQIPLDPIVDDGKQLCYRSELTNLDGPILTVHFEGADVVLTPVHIFIPYNGGIFCFTVRAFENVDNEFGIYGGFAQSNFLIGYDMEEMMISFKPADCTKQ